MARQTIAAREALKNPETLASVVHAILLQQYGEEAYTWDPTTVWLELKDDFKVETDPAVLERWSAMGVVMLSGAFFQRLDAFLGICNTLATGSPFFSVFDPVTPEEAAWAIAEVSLNRELLPFSYAIKQYLKTVLKQEGFDGDYPTIFEEALGPRPRAQTIKEGLQVSENETNIDSYIDEQLRDLVHQFNELPDLRGVDNAILHRGMDEFVGTAVAKET